MTAPAHWPDGPLLSNSGLPMEAVPAGDIYLSLVLRKEELWNNDACAGCRWDYDPADHEDGPYIHPECLIHGQSDEIDALLDVVAVAYVSPAWLWDHRLPTHSFLTIHDLRVTNGSPVRP